MVVTMDFRMTYMLKWIGFLLVIDVATLAKAQSYIVASLPFIIGETDSASCAMVRDSPRLEKFPLQWRNGSNIINNDEIRTSLIPRSTYFSYTSTIGFVTTAFMNNDVLSCAAPVHSESETKVKIHVQSKINPPVISGSSTVTSGSNHTWTCSVDGGSFETPIISWWNGSKAINAVDSDIASEVTDPIVEYTNLESSLILYRRRSRLTLSIVEGSEDFSLRCIAEQRQTDTIHETSAKISIMYAPRILTVATNYSESEVFAVELPCVVEASPKISCIKWFKNGLALTTNTSHYGGGTLTSTNLLIHSLNTDDNGLYTCVATNSAGSSESPPFYLNVKHKPIVTSTDLFVMATLGSDALLSCTVRAFPTTSDILWYKINENGEDKLLEVPSRGATTGGSKYVGSSVSSPDLTILDVGAMDDGFYHCAAVNSIGRGEGPRVQLTLNAPPIITGELGNVTTTTGDNVTLVCDVFSGPNVTTLAWFHGEYRINVTASSNYVIGNESVSCLIIRNVSYLHIGDYTCRVENEFGTTTSKPTRLLVHHAPVLRLLSSELFSKKGEAIQLQVEVSAEPQPVAAVMWFHQISEESEFVVIDLSLSKYSSNVTDGGVVLTVHNLTVDDAGGYRVAIGNSLGNSTSDSIIVGVFYAPTNITVSGLDNPYREGRSILLFCLTDGLPEPRYQWLRASKPPVLGNALNISSAGPVDGGLHTCRSYNNFGSEQLEITIDVHYRPRSNLRQSKNSAALGTSVALQCDVDSNPEPDFFNWTHNDNALNESGREVTILVNSDNDFGLYLCTATLKDFGSSEPITFHIVDTDDTVASARVTTAMVALIVILLVILMVILLLTVVYCVKAGRCSKRKSSAVGPSKMEHSAALPRKLIDGVTLNGYTTFTVSKPPAATSHDQTKIDMGDRQLAQEHLASQPYGMSIYTTTTVSKPPAATSNDSTKVDKVDRQLAQALPASHTYGMSISIPGPIIPTPHRLPPLGFDGDVQQTESALDENLPTIVKRRLKKHRVAVP